MVLQCYDFLADSAIPTGRYLLLYGEFSWEECMQRYPEGGCIYMRGWREPILVGGLTYIRLLLHIGIKVADEWLISLIYVRGSNIYVRGYLDLRAWSLRLRT